MKGWAAGQSSDGRACGHVAVAGPSIVGVCEQN